MNIDYFFKDTDTNTSIKTLYEKINNVKTTNNSEDGIFIPLMSFSLVFSIFISVLSTLFTQLIDIILKTSTNSFYLEYCGTLFSTCFFIPIFIYLIMLPIEYRDKAKLKKDLQEKLNLFYQENNYLPILKTLKIFENLCDIEKKFLINLNNKNLNYGDILYISKMYTKYTEENLMLTENEIINSMKNKVFNKENNLNDNVQIEDLKFFNKN